MVRAIGDLRDKRRFVRANSNGEIYARRGAPRLPFAGNRIMQTNGLRTGVVLFTSAPTASLAVPRPGAPTPYSSPPPPPPRARAKMRLHLRSRNFLMAASGRARRLLASSRFRDAANVHSRDITECEVLRGGSRLMGDPDGNTSTGITSQ